MVRSYLVPDVHLGKVLHLVDDILGPRHRKGPGNEVILHVNHQQRPPRAWCASLSKKSDLISSQSLHSSAAGGQVLLTSLVGRQRYSLAPCRLCLSHSFLATYLAMDWSLVHPSQKHCL